MKKQFPNPKIDELIVTLKTQRANRHGFLMAVSRASDVNYNNLCSFLTGNRRMGYHVFFAVTNVLPRIVREFEKKESKKKE